MEKERSITCPKCEGPNKPDATECFWFEASLVKEPQPVPQSQLQLPPPQEETQKSEVLIPEVVQSTKWLTTERPKWMPLPKPRRKSHMTGGKLLGILFLIFVIVGFISDSMPEGKDKDAINTLMGAILILFIPFGILCWAANNIVRAFGGGGRNDRD